jgi:ATP synthase mitochondrial F1 complex assembly factor 2
VHQRIKGRRRFYKTVSVRPVEGEEHCWEILLDRHVLRTPGRRPLRFPTETLARAVAAEWDAQVAASGIEPTVMPLMTLTATAIDQIAVQPAVTIENVMRYLPTDTVCFFAPEYDRIMRKRQHQHWEPLHQWMSQSVGAELGRTMDNLARPKHDAAAVSKVQAVVEALDPFTLSAVQCITMECKSLVIALAVAHRHISIEQVCSIVYKHIRCNHVISTVLESTVRNQR